MPERETAACFTGHRMIPVRDIPSIRRRIVSAVQQAYENGYRVFFCGGARGFDTIAAQEIIKFRGSHPDVRLVIAVPCAAQAELWPEKDRETYHSILKNSDETIVLSESYYNGCMQYRNRYMVNHSSLCLCYMTRFEGGTWITVRYALHEGITLKNLAMRDTDRTVLRENSWSSTFTFRSVQGNAGTVHLSHFRRMKPGKRNI